METTYAIIVSIIITLVSLWIIKRRKHYRIFKELGIPGPEPNLILGNLREINQKTLPGALKDWKKKYGRNFGYFMGAAPFVVTTDTEILKQIQIKDFHSFINRPRLVPGGIVADNKFNKHVISERNDRWKQQRATLTPTFTSGKMKQMIVHMDPAVDILLDKIEKNVEKDEGFDIFEMFKGLTLDIISRTAFGTQTNVQSNDKDPFLLGVKELLGSGPVAGLSLASMCFPEIKFMIYPMRRIQEGIKYYLSISHVRIMIQQCVEMVQWRRADPKNRRDDLLQLMLDAEVSSDDKSVSSDSLTAGYDSEATQSISKGLDTNSKKKTKLGLNDVEIASNTVIFVFAGYETTSTALAYFCHVLVNKTDIQDKIRNEILQVEAENGKIDYLALNKLKYMEMVFSEVLRYYPPVTTFVNRESKKTVTYGNIQIPVGVNVQVPVELLHRDPEYWEEPDKFVPERFAPENRGKINSMAYQAFGAGPRNCIGMRFAQMEVKLALANILKNYKLVPYAKTEMGDIETVFKVAITQPKNGVFVKAVKV